MILLGVNAGFGNTDCAELPLGAVDLDHAIIDYPRPKTEVQRRVTLWPETVRALQSAIDQRPEPKHEADAHRVFLTRQGTPWLRYHGNGDAKGWKRDNVGREFKKVKDAAGMNGKHRGFYALRHTFETIGGETGDQKAVDFIMGHAPRAHDMGAIYREWIGDDRETARLKRVTDHVRRWLWCGRDLEAVNDSTRNGLTR
jgi:integrase